METNNEYKKAEIEGKEDLIEQKVIAFVESWESKDDDENIKILNYLKNAVGEAVDVINSPELRVDGYCIQPILKTICNEKLVKIMEARAKTIEVE